MSKKDRRASESRASPTRADVPETPGDRTRGNAVVRHLFLILCAFLSGASVMIVELAGNRILAPWFGNSLYTWTGLIGVILT